MLAHQHFPRVGAGTARRYCSARAHCCRPADRARCLLRSQPVDAHHRGASIARNIMYGPAVPAARHRCRSPLRPTPGSTQAESSSWVTSRSNHGMSTTCTLRAAKPGRIPCRRLRPAARASVRNSCEQALAGIGHSRAARAMWSGLRAEREYGAWRFDALAPIAAGSGSLAYLLLPVPP